MIALPPATRAAVDELRAALHRLDAPPAGAAWNATELEGIVPAATVQAAVLVGLVPRAAGLQVLLTRRTAALRQHAGQVSFPGGRIEPDDADTLSAALRETEEEIGVAASGLAPLGYLDPLATVTGFRVLPVVAIVTPDYVARPDPREVDEVFEVPLEFLMAPANLEQLRIDFQGRPRAVLEFVDRGVPGQRIWGATASILYNLRERMLRGREAHEGTSHEGVLHCGTRGRT